MSAKLSIAQWRTAVEGAANEIATYALSFSGAVVQDPVDQDRANSMIGAHIPLVGGGQAFDMALVSSADGCHALSRAILCAAPTATLRDKEIADAVGEIVNMLAGAVKRRLSGHRADLEFGLPIFFHGYIQPSDRLAVLTLPTRFNTIETMVLIAGAKG